MYVALLILTGFSYVIYPGPVSAEFGCKVLRFCCPLAVTPHKRIAF